MNNYIQCTKQKSNLRVFYFDIIRTLACVMVVLMHSPFPSYNAVGWFCGTISFLTYPSIGLFFMVSGALLIPRENSLFDFLRRRSGRIIIPTLIWTVLYMILNVMVNSAPVSFNDILSIPFSAQGHGVLWFMYTLMGIYLITPILSPWLNSATKKELIFVLSIWGISLVIPIFSGIIKYQEDVTSILYYFSGFIGYYILGFFLNKFIMKSSSYLCIILYVLIVISLFLLIRYNENYKETFDSYLNIFTAIMCVCIFIIIKNLRFTDNSTYVHFAIVNLSKLSFGIYFIHIAIMRFVLWKMTWFINIHNFYIQTAISFLLTFALSWFIVYIINNIRGAKYIIG